MLSPDAFEQWCWRLGLSDEAKAAITHIRPSPQARHVQSSAGNMSGTYPSLTMGCGIQFESHRDELPFAYPIDHDSNVLEFYDQPAGEIKMNKSVPTSPEEMASVLARERLSVENRARD